MGEEVEHQGAHVQLVLGELGLPMPDITEYEVHNLVR